MAAAATGAAGSCCVGTAGGMAREPFTLTLEALCTTDCVGSPASAVRAGGAGSVPAGEAGGSCGKSVGKVLVEGALVAGGFIVTGAAGGAGIDGGGPPLPVRVLGGMESKSGAVELLDPAIGIVGSRRSISARTNSGRSSMIE